jgi:uncharacterized protein YbaA (DUF1428 family)
VIFSWITYRDRASRDEIMADESMKSEEMPFDGKRMIFGGFETFVDL